MNRLCSIIVDDFLVFKEINSPNIVDIVNILVLNQSYSFSFLSLAMSNNLLIFSAVLLSIFIFEIIIVYVISTKLTANYSLKPIKQYQ